MPQFIEQKYHVDNMDDIESCLHDLGADFDGEHTSTHYYAPTNEGVKKVVQRKSGFYFVEMSQKNGRFEVFSQHKLPSLVSGYQTLKTQGFKEVDVVEMKHRDYRLRNGIVGLYVINGNLPSIIIDFPDGSHEKVEHELGLKLSMRINDPFSRILRQMKLNKTIKI